MTIDKRKILIFVLILLIFGLVITSYLMFFKRNATLDCNSYSIDECPKECVVCPPCEACSSISCQTKEFCERMGFDKEWYEQYVVR